MSSIGNRREFRPLGSLSLSLFTRFTLVQMKLCPRWLLGSLVFVVFLGWFGLVCCFVVCLWVAFPHQYAEFPILL